MALIIKERGDGAKRRLLIIDARRSGVNDRAAAPQRVILPRLRGAADSLLDLLEEPRSSREEEEEVELALADFSDARCHLRAAPEEWPHL